MTHRILAARLRRCLAFALALLMAAVLAMQATRPALADDKQKELENKKNQIQQELDALKQEQTQNQETIDSAEAQRETATKKKDLLQQQMAVIQQKIDEYKKAGRKIPAEWIKNPFYLKYYREKGMLRESTPGEKK